MVLGPDVDPVRIAIARHNADVMGLPVQFKIADIRNGIPSSYDCIFYDPGRRVGAGSGAGLVQALALELGTTMLNETNACLTMDHKVDTLWVRYWQVSNWMAFQLKRLRHYLVERGAGKLTVKKRGFALAPEELIAPLRQKLGSESRLPVMTR